MSDPVIADLRARRRQLRLSRAALADALGTVQSQVAEWETGAVVPRLDTLCRWARALGLTITTEEN